jgi:hypothetical protein
MKFHTEMTVVGMKASKGMLENGQTYDSTKIYVLTDLDASKGNAFGQASAEYAMGTSDESNKYKHLPFPFRAVAECELVTNGKAQKTVVVGLKPITDQKVSAKAA